MNIKKLTLEEKIGQRFIFGINSSNIDCIIDLIKYNYIGGVVLYKKNYRNYDEMLDVIKKIKLANKKNQLPLFIAIDQEGGVVNRMPSEFHVLRNLYDTSIMSDKLVYENAKITGKMLGESGINMNFAPVVDIYNNSRSKALYKRCFYGSYEDVIRNEEKYLEGFKKSKVIPVIKHFPGHGLSKFDSHFFVPYVFDYERVFRKHILPFNVAIEEGIDAIMIGHLVIRKLTKLLPASISKGFIDDYLKNNDKFKGIVITDEINMLSRNIFYHFNYINNALKSSSDVILVKIKNKEDAMKIFQKYRKILFNSNYVNALNSSVERISTVKEKYNINDDVDNIGTNVAAINKEIDRINSKVIVK